MTKTRIFELAADLGVESEHVIQMLRQMDVRVKSHMSTVDEAVVARLHARLEREKRGAADEALETSGSPSRRRRRRRAPEPVAEVVEPVEHEDGTAEEFETAEADESPETAEIIEVVELPADDEPVEAPVAGVVDVEVDETAEEVEAEVVAEADVEDDEFAEEDVSEDAEPHVAAEAGDEGLEADAPSAEPAAALKSARESAAEAEAAAAAATAATEEGRQKRKRKPKPARGPTPAASAAPAGTVNVHAEGYTADGRRRGRRDRKRQRRVDKDAVQENVKKTLVAMGTGTAGRKRRRDAGPRQQEVERELQEQREEAEKTTVRVNEFLTVAELADQLESTANEIITSAFKNLGLMVTINQRLDFDQIELICDEFGYIVAREVAYEADLPEVQAEAESDEDVAPRAPVVTVMGHVDHGKTSLLDHVRRTNVIAGEAGGITQHIGAYHVELDDERSVTFLDTPGHEAFTAMRARGAELTDIVILVVAADDAVMPQTIEAISHAKNAGVPMVVAINKIDLPAANVPKVKQDLLTHEVILEEFGGDVLSSEVSAKKGTGIDDLLEKVLLQAEMLDLQARPSGPARGVVIEAELDKGMGPVATVLVQSGELNVGDDFICGLYGGRVRNLLDERGNQVEWVGPSIPVRVLGVEGVPQAGDNLVEMDAARLREVVARRQQLEREKSMRRRSKGTRLEDIFTQIQAGDRALLNLVIKGDTDGSVQALSDSLERLSTDEVAVEVIHRGVGAVTEGDVLLATTGAGAVIGFHVRPDNKARGLAEREGVQIRTYNVIYEAVEDVRMALEGMLAPEEREIIVGSAEVRELFRVPKAGTVAGCYVTSGTMHRNLSVRLLRDYVQIYEGKIGSLRRFKEDVREVKDGYECGLSIEGYNDVKVGDVVECYRVEEIARTLAQSGSAT